jgi:hypothetical protein
MERRWRFVYDRERVGRWGWQMHENGRVRMASLLAFDTLEGCISHARDSGFSFAQGYDIVFGEREARAAGQ